MKAVGKRMEKISHNSSLKLIECRRDPWWMAGFRRLRRNFAISIDDEQLSSIFSGVALDDES